MAHIVKEKTLGSPLRRTAFRDFSISEVRYAPGVNLPAHEHDFTYLSLVLRGSFHESVGRHTASAQSASVVVMPRGVIHGECIGSLGARSVTIALKSSCWDEFAGGRHPFREWRWFHGGRVARTMLRVYREYLLADDVTELGLGELLLELRQTMVDDHDCNLTSARRCVAAAAERLHVQSADRVRLSDLAADLGKDPAYLARAFRCHMGCTMSQYRRRLWVRQAAHLLASTNASLGQVAFSSGFTDQSHLCRVFKAELGVTPQAYRVLAAPR